MPKANRDRDISPGEISPNRQRDENVPHGGSTRDLRRQPAKECPCARARSAAMLSSPWIPLPRLGKTEQALSAHDYGDGGGRVCRGRFVCRREPSRTRSITYDYTGNAFDTVDPHLPQTLAEDISNLGSSVTASFTFDGAVTSDFTGSVSELEVTSFSVSTGPITITTVDPGESVANFSFLNGNITGWSVVETDIVEDVGGNALGDTIVTTSDSNGYFDSVIGYAGTAVGGGQGFVGQVWNDIAPGTWTEVSSAASVPEPAALTLLCMGLAGLGVLRRRKTA